jgi:RNA polymerase sigma-70 factor, ECF subfamily
MTSIAQVQPDEVDDSYLTDCLAAAQSGDQWRLSIFIRHTQQPVHRLMTYLGAREESEDLVQETYVRAMKALPKYRGDSSGRVWLFGIARKVAMDSLRSKCRRQKLQAALFMQRNESSVGPDAYSTELDMLLDTLDADRRSAFVLTQILGLSYDEAAAASKCAVGTIRSRVARARSELIGMWND